MGLVLLNMCEIYDKSTGKVVVLDKVKKEGWEGLTYPGGHVEKGESIYDSVVREVFEETGLRLKDADCVGVVHWISENVDEHLLGFLYRSCDFEGELIENNREGTLKWKDRDEFINTKDGKADSIDDILDIYSGNLKEIMYYYNYNTEKKAYEFLYSKKI